MAEKTLVYNAFSLCASHCDVSLFRYFLCVYDTLNVRQSLVLITLLMS